MLDVCKWSIMKNVYTVCESLIIRLCVIWEVNVLTSPKTIIKQEFPFILCENVC